VQLVKNECIQWICLFSSAKLPKQKEKGFPVNPGLHIQLKVSLNEVPLVEFTLMHCARTPQGEKSHGSEHKMKYHVSVRQ